MIGFGMGYGIGYYFEGLAGGGFLLVDLLGLWPFYRFI